MSAYLPVFAMHIYPLSDTKMLSARSAKLQGNVAPTPHSWRSWEMQKGTWKKPSRHMQMQSNPPLSSRVPFDKLYKRRKMQSPTSVRRKENSQSSFMAGDLVHTRNLHLLR